MSNNFIKTERQDGVLKLTMVDLKTRNALGPEMVDELYEELDRFEETPEDRVLLLTGEDPSFCSGANIRRFREEIRSKSASQISDGVSGLPWGEMEAGLENRRTAEPNSPPLMPLRIHNLQKPSIAAVNGHAIGVGMGLALACDIRIASEQAVFSEAFVKMGLIPGDGSCWQLPRLIGLSQTFLLQYTGDVIDGNEAYRLGLVSKVYPKDELMTEAVALATRIAQGATYSMSLIKYLVQKSMDMDLSDSLELARVAQEKVQGSEDHKEAVQAFLEKRKPNFQGR
jgi:enoyl-CoA hydratase/carnithine racemase